MRLERDYIASCAKQGRNESEIGDEGQGGPGRALLICKLTFRLMFLTFL